MKEPYVSALEPCLPATHSFCLLRPYFPAKEPCISINKRALHIYKRAPCIHKRALCIHKRALCICTRALSTRNTFRLSVLKICGDILGLFCNTFWIYGVLLQHIATHSVCLLRPCTHVQIIPQRVPYICKRALIPAKEPSTSSQQPYISLKSPLYPQKSPTFPPKVPMYQQKSPAYPQKQTYSSAFFIHICLSHAALHARLDIASVFSECLSRQRYICIRIRVLCI